MNRTRHAKNQRHLAMNQVEPLKPTKAQLADMCDESIYVLRTDDGLVKVGYSTNLTNRINAFGRGRWERLLALRPGTYAEEQEIHSRLAPYRARGREYYHPVPELLEFVNEIRRGYGLSELTDFSQ